MNEHGAGTGQHETFDIRVQMLSDWHIGTGAGIPGNIDALIARDADGFPYLPAKTVTGLWRDAVERLAYGLDNGNENGAWSAWVGVIFGSQPAIEKIPDKKPRPALLSVQPLRLSSALRNAILVTEDERLKQALTFIKPEIAIDDQSGTAKTNMLRFAEMGRIDTILEGKCLVDFTGCAQPQRELIMALLTAGAKLVERIGGKRRRGAGKCAFHFPMNDGSIEPIVERLQHATMEEVNTLPKEKAATTQYTFAGAASDELWQTLGYTLKLSTPVAIVTAVLGNVSETLDYIPGTYLLPYVTKRIGNGVFPFLANGDIQVSPATITVCGKRGIPAPRAIFHDKNGGGFDKKNDNKATVRNRLTEIESKEQQKNFRTGFIDSLGDKSCALPHYEKTPLTLMMHNTVEDRFQRPTENVVGVFSREAIAAGATLKGEIRFRSSALPMVGRLQKIVEDIRIGKSKKDDYGLATISFDPAIEPYHPDGSAATQDLVLYLESDVLLRNASLRQSALYDDLKNELEKTLGPGALAKPDPKSGFLPAVIQTRRIESWHERWGFPRPSLIAAAAGSCAQFNIRGYQAMNAEEKEQLAQNIASIEKQGIGERRGEGYGRIRFNPPLLASKLADWKPALPDQGAGGNGTPATARIGEDMKAFAKLLETTSWREELCRKALTIADNEVQRKNIFGFTTDNNGESSSPPLSQIAGLGSIIDRMKTAADAQTVRDWLKHLEDTPNRKNKWPEIGKIKILFQEGNQALLWKFLELDEPPVLVSPAGDFKKELWPEAMRILFDACFRAHKRNLKN